MESIRCKNCGGSMVLDASGITASCCYCGSSFLLDHQDTDYYQNFYARMNAFFSAPRDAQVRKQQAEALWGSAQSRVFIPREGVPIEVKYMHRYTDRDADVYVARRNVIFHFPKQGAEHAAAFRRNIAMLDYPSADVRNLQEFFPRITGGFELADGSYLLVIAKDEDEYPLRLFGRLHGRHVAWIISRMENLCCVLEFSSLVHPQITPDTLYINPYTHQASLYGNWWNVGRHNMLDRRTGKWLQMRQNLLCLRAVAALSLGCRENQPVKRENDIPAALADFINSQPKATAYDDFAFWDEMLMKAYGERKFITMETDDSQIYGRKG